MTQVSAPINLISKAREYFRTWRADRQSELVEDGVLRLRRYSQRMRSRNARDRYYDRKTLIAQLQPEHQADLLDEILIFMEKEGLARQVLIPGLWEITPFVC